jgi:hypothetical protein
MVRDVLGTWLLSILDGHCRYAHVAGLRRDGVAPEILLMNKIISDESLRRALGQIAPAPKKDDEVARSQERQEQVGLSDKWMSDALMESVEHALSVSWILDIDTSVKTLYGNQKGAEVGYNPHKPGRPSHTIHTYWLAGLRLVLDVQIQDGKSGSAAHSLPGLVELLNRLPQEKRPKLARGDCAFGNDRVMRQLEDIDQCYLFKLKQTSNVKKLIESQWMANSWCDAGQGWEAREDRLKLIGWGKERRVIVLRRPMRDLAEEKASTTKKRKHQSDEGQQLALDFLVDRELNKVYEYAVLVSNAPFHVQHTGQLYRDRADCENGFDELKNQWGWGGYSTQDIERCNLSARAVALVYNWWSWYARLANPGERLEAITSRPLLLAGVARLTTHSGQKRVLLSITHDAEDKVMRLVANIREGLQHVRSNAPQLDGIARWKALVGYIVEKILNATANKMTRATAPPVLGTG